MIPISRGGIAIDISVADHTINFDALYVGVSGNVKITKFNGDTVTYNDVPVGWMPVAGTKVFKAGTTATNLIQELFHV